MKRLVTETRDIFEIPPSDESLSTPVKALKRHKRKASEPKRKVLAPKDTNITTRTKRKAVELESPPQKPAKRRAAKQGSKIPVRVKEDKPPPQTHSPLPTNDIRSYFRPRTPLLDQLQECLSEEGEEDYWQKARQKKTSQAKKTGRPGTPAVQRVRHRSPSPETDHSTPTQVVSSPNLCNAGTTPRYPRVLMQHAPAIPPTVRRTRLQSKQAIFGIGATYLPEDIPEYEWTVDGWSEESDQGLLDINLCTTSTPIQAFRSRQTSIADMSFSPTR